MVSYKLVLAVLCALSIAAVSSAANAQWQVSDSLPSLYNSYSAYCDPDFIKTWTCGFCKHNPGTKFVGFLEDSWTAVFGYVTIFNNEVNVVFRGSECFYNWIDNLNFWWTPYTPVPGTYVHRGFWDAYKNVQAQTRQTVEHALKLCRTCKTIRVTGHSLGGALATHGAADLSFSYNKLNSSAPVIKLTTFGSPRVGDKTFSTWLDSQLTSSWRMTHYCDPVPHLPPTVREINWHHVATEIYEGSNPTNYKQCDGSGEDPTCADGILLPFQPRDHLTYMGVSVEDGKHDNCQKAGPDCSVFMNKYLNMDWSKEISTLKDGK